MEQNIDVMIFQISELLKDSKVDEAIDKVKDLSFDDKCEVILSVIDNQYNYKEDAKKDKSDNADVLKFLRNFKDVNKFLLK